VEKMDDESGMTSTTWGCKTNVCLMLKWGSVRTGDAAQGENIAGTSCLFES